VVIINRGKIVADGSMQSIKESAVDKKNIHLSLRNADYKSVESLMSTIGGIMDVTRVAEMDGQLDVRLGCQSSIDPRAAIYENIKQTDWVLLDFHQKTQTLETIFRELTREREHNASGDLYLSKRF
jgi:ABC-2 type transport system ATP-binding protein